MDLNRPGRLPALATDVALGGCFLVALLIERFMLAPVPARAAAPAALAGCGLAVAIALRRRFPLGAFVLSAAALCAEVLTTPASWLSPYANLLGVFSVALHATRRRAWWGLAILIGCIGVYFAARPDFTRLTQPAGVLLVWLAMWSVGYAMARRREEQQHARQLIQERAMAGERARIARELHDLVGHTVNLMLMQAGASRRVLDQDPSRARALLADLERAGRDALTELDRVLGVLRSDDPDGDHPAGSEGLSLLPGLAHRMTEAGLRVTVNVGAGVHDLPRSLDLTAYRIVQESLTNTLKHADARAAEVAVLSDGTWLDITVRDDGRGPGADYRPGRGLLGIRERVTLFGGDVSHGPAEDGGFLVRCRLPLAPVAGGAAGPHHDGDGAGPHHDGGDTGPPRDGGDARPHDGRDAGPRHRGGDDGPHDGGHAGPRRDGGDDGPCRDGAGNPRGLAGPRGGGDAGPPGFGQAGAEPAGGEGAR